MSIALALPPRLDPFQQQLQSRPVHLARANPIPAAHKATRLQPLRPDAKARTVEIQHPHLRRTPIDEAVQRTVRGVFRQTLAHQCLQPIERAAHVSRLPVEQYANLALRKEHQPRDSVSSTPSPRSSRNSMRAPLPPRAPRSTNSAG